MKHYFFSLILVQAICSFACGENKAVNENLPADTSSNQTAAVSDPGESPVTDNDIVGTWKLRLEVFDDNGNRIPDEEEMKKGYGNNYMLQLNADGTCRIQQVYTGRYETITEDGRKMLKVYRKRIEGEEDKDPIPDIYQIISVKKDELVLQINDAGGPGSFWFFKRIK